MKKISVFLITLVALGVLASPVFSQEDRDVEQLYSTIAAMKSEPLSKSTKKMREKAFKWVSDTKKVSVVVCSDPIGPFIEQKEQGRIRAFACAYLRNGRVQAEESF